MYQETYDSASRTAGKRARQLRKHGFRVTCSPLGPQITPVGKINLTLISVDTDAPWDLPKAGVLTFDQELEIARNA